MAAELAATGLEGIAGRIDELRRAQRRERERGKQVASTRDALDALVEMAEAAEPEDPKLRAALDEIRAIRTGEPRANVLVYTEYTDSQDALVAYLHRAREHGDLDGDVLAISGRPEHAQDRTTVTDRFATESGIVLVSTDATAEGLNLHERCHHLVHLELPYNPNRLEQRNGRIDRYGQRENPCVCYLYLAGTFEERLLLRLVAKYERQRARLTFVPNTLGGITTDDAQTVRLLEGLADEEQSLFVRPPREIRRIEQSSDDDVAAPAYQELLAEVERAMAGYEKTAKTNAWLSEAGLNADARLVTEAGQARQEGERLGAVELMNFVCSALEADGGTVVPVDAPAGGEKVVDLRLPPVWTHGLRDIPGYDTEERTLRLTTDRRRVRDDSGRRLGYLGRAHPIVRRALDRVRNLRFGEADAWLDRRISAIEVDGESRALLCTFLGIVESARGHEYERILAVRVNEAGTRDVFVDPVAWRAIVEEGRPADTRDLWEQAFADWADPARAAALDAARDAFREIAAPQLQQHRLLLETEQRELTAWVLARADTICGPATLYVQQDFFSEAPALPSWKTLSDPAGRLVAFATDGTNPPAARREADGVVRLYQKRMQDLGARAEARLLDPLPLGLLMLIPIPGRPQCTAGRKEAASQ